MDDNTSYLSFIIYTWFFFIFREASYDIDKNLLKKKFNDIQKIYHPDQNSQNPEVENYYFMNMLYYI